MTVQLAHVKRDPRKLKRLQVNARFMTKETFDRLTENIRQDGALTQWPLIWLEPGEEEGRELVLSGNHRTDAAVAAGLEEVDCILLDAPDMESARATAIQLSHNSIAGEDDPATLKLLFESIDDVDWRAYAGLDDKTLDLLNEIEVEPLSEANLDFQQVQVFFLPDELERAQAALNEGTNWSADARWAGILPQYEPFLAALETARGAYGIGNTATAIGIILTIFERHLTDLAEGWIEPETGEGKAGKWPPVETILGARVMPAESAAIVRAAINRAIKDGAADKPWLALEMICADYLAAAREG